MKGEIVGGDGQAWGRRGVRGEIGLAVGATGLVAVDLPGALDPGAELHPHPPGLRPEFDPLEGIGVPAAVVDAAGGQFQTGAGRVRRADQGRLALVQVPAQHEIPVQVDQLARLVGVELGQVVPGVVQQDQAPVRPFAVRVQDGLVDLVAAKEQAPAVGIAAGHPGGIEPGRVQALIADLDGALPPGQGLIGAQPLRVEGEIGVVAPQQTRAPVVVAQQVGDRLL